MIFNSSAKQRNGRREVDEAVPSPETVDDHEFVADAWQSRPISGCPPHQVVPMRSSRLVQFAVLAASAALVLPACGTFGNGSPGGADAGW